MLDVISPYLPPAVGAEICALEESHLRFRERLSEVRLRSPGASSLTLDGKNFLLGTAVSREDLEKTAERLCHGSLYAYRDCLLAGYLPLPGGIRVGAVGTARYENGKIAGVEGISALSFRLPRGVCDNTAALVEAFGEARRGMLILSPPGGGKTSALRALSFALASGQSPRRVAVLDTRMEFPPEAFAGTTVDLLRGYAPGAGLEIALRTLSPEVIVMDEIGGTCEAEALLSLSDCGVPLIASAHAATPEDARRRPTLAPFFSLGVFDVCVCLSRRGDEFFLSREAAS